MNACYETLFNYWCKPHETVEFPSHLEGDPIKAYGVYSFEEGFKLAQNLAAPLLTQDDFDPHQ